MKDIIADTVGLLCLVIIVYLLFFAAAFYGCAANERQICDSEQRANERQILEDLMEAVAND